MILECPECSTRYLVPDSAIGAEGRTVRCAKCRHSWFQEPGEVLDMALEPDMAVPAAASTIPPAPGFSASVFTAPDTPPIDRAHEAAPPPPSSLPASFVEPATAPADYDAFAHRPPFRARRSSAKRRTIAAVTAGVLMLLAVVAILLSGAPNLAAKLGIPIGSAESPLLIKDNPIERRGLDNGSELFAVSGRVTNPSGDTQRIPDIRAELRDAQGKLVYSWTITPQKRSLAPGGSVDFNSAKLDVPSNSKRLELSFAGEGER